MTEHSFSLAPFPNSNAPAIQITGKISRVAALLSVQCSMTGDMETILFTPKASQPARRGELWTTTCFEFFLAVPDRPEYWEFNLSPSGDWNIFHMDAYRRIGFREEILIPQLPVSFHRDSECVRIDTTVDLSPIMSEDTPIQVGITSVVKTIGGTETYWALTHPRLQADFHSRETFTIQL